MTWRALGLLSLLTLSLLLASCGELQRHVAGLDLLYADSGAAPPVASYAFDGSLVDAAGNTSLTRLDDSASPLIDDLVFVEDRDGNPGSAVVVRTRFAVLLPDEVLPRSVVFWARSPSIEEAAGSADSPAVDTTVQVALTADVNGLVDPQRSPDRLLFEIRNNYEFNDLSRRISLQLGDRNWSESKSREVNDGELWTVGEWQLFTLIWDRAGYLNMFIDGRALVGIPAAFSEEDLSFMSGLVVNDWEGVVAIDDLQVYDTVLSRRDMDAIYAGTFTPGE